MLESQDSRKIIGFDAFGKFPRASTQEDESFIDRFEGAAGQGITDKELQKTFAYKGFTNYEFIRGNILETVPEYAKNHPELRIALLHIDVDVYEPTKTILENLFCRIVRNGIIVLDDYGTVSGETQAVEEFLSQIKEKYALEKLPYYKIPTFIVKK